MPMQQLLVRPRPLSAVADGDAQPCAAAAIDFCGETSGSSSSDSDAPLPRGECVLGGRVWRFGGGGVMVATAVQGAGGGGRGEEAASEAVVRVVQLGDLEALAAKVML